MQVSLDSKSNANDEDAAADEDHHVHEEASSHKWPHQALRLEVLLQHGD